jgi:hypothetical protein
MRDPGPRAAGEVGRHGPLICVRDARGSVRLCLTLARGVARGGSKAENVSEMWDRLSQKPGGCWGDAISRPSAGIRRAAA